MKSIDDLWNVVHSIRTEEEWVETLNSIAANFSNYIGFEVIIEAYRVSFDEGNGHGMITSRIKIPVSINLGAYFIGVLRVSVDQRRDVGDQVWVEASLLSLLGDRRICLLTSPKSGGEEVFVSRLMPLSKETYQWSPLEMYFDEAGEWERIASLSDWEDDINRHWNA